MVGFTRLQVKIGWFSHPISLHMAADAASSSPMVTLMPPLKSSAWSVGWLQSSPGRLYTMLTNMSTTWAKWPVFPRRFKVSWGSIHLEQIPTCKCNLSHKHISWILTLSRGWNRGVCFLLFKLESTISQTQLVLSIYSYYTSNMF